MERPKKKKSGKGRQSRVLLFGTLNVDLDEGDHGVYDRRCLPRTKSGDTEGLVGGGNPGVSQARFRLPALKLWVRSRVPDYTMAGKAISFARRQPTDSPSSAVGKPWSR